MLNPLLSKRSCWVKSYNLYDINESSIRCYNSQRQTRLSIDNVEQNKRHDTTEERLDIIEEVIENFEDIPVNITNNLEYLEAENDRNIMI